MKERLIKVCCYLLQKTFPEYEVIPCSAEAELALREATRHNLIDYTPGENYFTTLANRVTEKKMHALTFLKEFLRKYETTGVQEILNKTVFSLLDYVAAYPVENEHRLTDREERILPDVQLLKKGSTALDLAYKVHTDIGKKFSCAIDIYTQKRLKKDYVLKHHDILKIMTT